MRGLFVLGCLLFSLAICSAEITKIVGNDGEVDISWLNPEGSSIIHLDEKNFDETIAQNEFVLVEFYTPWCQHCRTIAPTYEQLATKLKDNSSVVICAKVSGVDSQALPTRFEVDGFPKFMLFRDGVPTSYQGPGSLESFEQFVEKGLQPASRLLRTPEEVQEFTSLHVAKAVAVVGKEGSKHYKTWKKVALSDGFGWMKFAHVEDPVLLGEGVKLPSVRVFPPVGAEFDFTPELFVKSKIVDFITKEGYPLVQALNEDSWHEISSKSVPHLCVLFAQGEEDFDLALKLAKKYKASNVTVTYKSLNASQAYWADQWGASGSFYPTAVLITWPQPNEPVFAAYDENSGAFTYNAATSFVNKALKDDYEPFRKSEEAPEKNDFPVTIVVGKTFEEIVYQDDKDVVVDFYAPWCEYSSALVPVWELVGEVFEKEPSVVIAKFDITQNKPPRVIDRRVPELPTLFLFPAGKKDNASIIEFPAGTDRTVKNIVTWLTENLVTKVTTVDLNNLPVEPELPMEEEEPEEELLPEKLEL